MYRQAASSRLQLRWRQSTRRNSDCGIFTAPDITSSAATITLAFRRAAAGSRFRLTCFPRMWRWSILGLVRGLEGTALRIEAMESLGRQLARRPRVRNPRTAFGERLDGRSRGAA